MKNIIRGFAFLLFFASIFISLVHAQTEEKKSFIIGVELIEYQPYFGFDPANPENYVGYAREFLDAFAKDKGYNLDYRMLPIKRLYAEFFAGDLDFKFPDNATWAMEEKEDKTIYYSEPACDFTDGLIVHTDDKDITVDKIMEIGTVRGFTPSAYSDLISSKKVKVNETTSLPTLLKQVEAKRIDGAYGNIIVFCFALQNSDIEKKKLCFAEHLPHQKGSYMVSTMKYPEIINEINAFLKDNPELIDALRKKYHIDTLTNDLVAPKSTDKQ